MTRLKQMMPFAIALLIALPSIQVQAQSVPSVPTAKDTIVFNAAAPPSTGRPGRRSDAGSRGCGEGESASAIEPKPLLALVPTQQVTQQAASSTVVFGKTAAEHPTLWFYVPHRTSLTAIFVLQDQDGNSLYQADVALPKNLGILSLKLPTTIAPLQTGKLYHWFFKLYCKSISPPDSFVDGWIQRESLSSSLAQQLQTAALSKQVRLYAADGFWFDALTAAAELRRTNASDSAWAELLKAIGLETVAAEAIATP